MKKSISITVATLVTCLSANFVNPLGSAFKSTDNGGTLYAIDAYQDGIGAIVLDNQGTGFKIDNSAMNTLVYKYGESAKNNHTGLALRILLDAEATNQDREMVSNITNILSSNISSAPINVDGTSCDDGNTATVGETYLNNICQGGIVGNLASNGLIYDNCEGDYFSNRDQAAAYCASKGMRMPSLIDIKETSGVISVPSCPLPVGYPAWLGTYTSSAGSYYYFYSGENVYYDNTSAGLIRCVK